MTADQTLSLDDIKASVTAHHAELVARLAEARQARDQLNDEIRALVAGEADAARMVKALTPRKRGES